MAVKPTSDQLKQLIDALLSAFNYDELKQLVSFELDEELAWFTPVTGKRDLRTVVTELVLFYASQDGGLRRLLTAACKMNDGNELLEQVERDWDGIDFEPLSLPDDHPHQTIIHGDQIEGDKIGNDKVGRDKTTTGDIADSVFAVGEGAQANITHNYYGTDKPEPADPAPGDPPYLGLNYFTAADAHLFFGRTALTTELVAQLNTYNQSETRFLAVIGASGSGKSSLVRAGLVPALRTGAIDGSDRWVVHVVTPTALPLKSLAISLTQGSESVTAASTLMQDMVKEPNSLDLYASRLITGTSTGARLLLVVDQFEELFTLCKDKDEQQHFVDNLMTAATTNGPTVVVLTLRADFYAQCARFDDLRAALEGQQKYIGAMTEEELRQAIVQPAEKNGWDFEEGLVDRILDDVGNEPGALPLLSHALAETWDRRRGHTLTHAGYTDVGGVKGAIATTADRIYEDLSEEQKEIARTIFIRLTELGEGSEDTRRRVALRELQPTDGDIGRVEEVLQALANARLVTTHAEKDNERKASDVGEVEVAHEALIREWGTLRGWLDKDRDDLRTLRRLTEEATEWSNDQDASLLYRGARLEAAQTLAAANPAALNELEQTFLDASIAEEKRVLAERERLQREREEAAERELAQAKVASNRARLAALAALVALLAVVGVSIYGYLEYQSRQAQALEDKKIADAQGFVQEARDLTGNLQAEAAITKLNDAIALNPDLELDIEAESIDIRRTVAISLTTQGEALLRTARESDDEELWQSSFISATNLFTQAYALEPPPDAAVYVRIPAGEFEMGEGSSQHTVQVAEFWMGRTEVTKAQYKRCVIAEICEEPSDSQYEDERYANDPIVGVTWYKSSTYAQWVGGRLPTEAEWEYACRGTSGHIYPWGNDEPTPKLLNYLESPGSSTAPVGRYPDGESPFRLYDMAGNVWEWTSTQYQEYPYDADDGREEQSGNSNRTLRGGSFDINVNNVRCASRNNVVPVINWNINGFRVVVLESPGFLPSENSVP